MTLPLAGVQLALTRPPEQAQALTAAITAAGGQVLAFPLLDIVALDDTHACLQAIQPLSQFDWAIFISSNAVQYGMPLLQQQGIPATLQFAAIGPSTASQLHAAGVPRVLMPQGRYDSEALLALPEMQQMQGRRVLIVRGVGGRELMAETLQQRGAQVVFAECYRRINPQTSAAPLQQAAAQGNLHGVIVTSSEALRHLLALAGPAEWLKTVPLFVNHARIADQAVQAGLSAQVVPASSETTGDSAMLQLLLQYFHTSTT